MIKDSKEFIEKLKKLLPIDQQTAELCLAAVQEYGWALEFVIDQTPEICLAAVKK